MTREEAKRRAELYSALADGKTIQYKADNDEWVDLEMDLMCGIAASYKYRIKPEPKFRPFGWIKGIEKQEKVHIGRIFGTPDGVFITLSINEGLNYSSSYLFNKYTFADGTPFGIKE